jgi:8-oxo-dGTP pyrophosphatase MutT (NUDIX family)
MSSTRREFNLPSTAQERARAWLDGPHPVTVAPRPASTVLLVRDGEQGVEVFMLRRRTTMAFGAGALVFPGGGVEPRDGDEEIPWVGPAPESWARRMGTSMVGAQGYVCAAVRETFEECGVLLAGPAGPTTLYPPSSGAERLREQERLVTGEQSLAHLLRRRGFVLRSDLLRPWAHWVTPLFEPRRYDTRFFLAAVPPGQEAMHVLDGEADASAWWSADEVLERCRRGEILLMPPTLVCLEELAAAPGVEALLAGERRVREILPYLEKREEGIVLLADLPD